MKVLVVDDNALIRSMVKDFLTDMGHEVVGEADNGNDAIKLFAATRPELVLLDLIMPGKNGIETLKEIKAIDRGARVVMVTAVQQDSVSKDLLSKGAAAILNKPFMYSELEALLKPADKLPGTI